MEILISMNIPPEIGIRIEFTDPNNKPPLGGLFAYDSLRHEAIYFLAGETWKWDGSIWTNMHAYPSPPNSYLSSMAFYSKRGVIVFYGGYVDYSTWEWNGTNWTNKTPPVGELSPTACCDVAMAYDPTREVMVLYGGFRGDQISYSNETWEWDGTSWINRPTVGNPEVQISASMYFDIGRQRMVLFGGESIDVPNWIFTMHNNLWEYDGLTGTWMEISTTNPPEERMGAMMAYNSDRGMAVMFGGANYNNGETRW